MEEGVLMETTTMLELFGYLGSAIVIVSMLMTSVMKLRVINTVGSLLFSLYALLIASYPTMIMNLFLAGINIWHIIKLKNTSRHYDVVSVTEDDGFLEYFLANNKEDIQKYFPGFHPEEVGSCLCYIICCQSEPAGVFLAKPAGIPANTGRNSGDAETIQNTEEALEVVLDYTTPTYRDCSVGKFLYNELPAKGFDRLIAHSSSTPHTKYLAKMGFEYTERGYILEL